MITTSLEPFIIPLTVAILFLLFIIQSKGTHKIGALFGPVMIVWFLVLGVLGLFQLIQNPLILHAFHPANPSIFSLIMTSGRQ